MSLSHTNTLKSITADQYIELVQSLIDVDDYTKAQRLCSISIKYFPQNSALLVLQNVISEKIDTASNKKSTAPKTPSQKLQLLIHRIESVAQVLSKTSKQADAVELYTILKQLNPEGFLAYYRLGQLYFDQSNYGAAIRELEQANAIDPLHVFTLKKLGLANYIEDKAVNALENWIDGLIISKPSNNQEDLLFFQKHIKNAQSKIPGFNKSDRNRLFKKRQHHIVSLISNLHTSLKKSSDENETVQQSLDHWFVSEDAFMTPSQSHPPEKPMSLANLSETKTESALADIHKDPDLKQYKDKDEIEEIAQRLMQYTLFKTLSDKERLKIANFTSFVSLREGSYVFHENEPCYGIYFIDRGLIEYSNQNFNLFFSQGQLFGHENFLIEDKNMFTAQVKQESDLIFIDKAGLGLIFSRNKTLAMHFLWYFWKSLSFQYQELKLILSEYYSGNDYINAKIEHLPSIHLSQKQMTALSTVCQNSVFSEKSVLFDHGETPGSIYIVMSGKIKLIHKNLESLISKNQYFGELFLTNRSLRSSYKALVCQNNTEILRIDNSILKNLLQYNESHCYDFLKVLCVMLAHKLKALKKLA